MPVKPIQGVQRALRVIEAFAEAQPVKLAELHRTLGLDKSGAQRILVTLHDAGWIQPARGVEPSWELSPRALVFASRALGRTALFERARPVLHALREATGETVLLAVPDAGRIVAIEVVESRHLVRTVPQVGQVLPTEAGAAGAAIMAYLSPDEVRQWVGRTDVGDLLDELAETRHRGWSLLRPTAEQQVVSMGAAWLDPANKPIAAIVIVGPSGRLTPDKFEDVAATLLAGVATLG